MASQNKAEAAQKAGKFKDEIVPVMIPQRKGDPVAFDTDEFVKAGTTLDSIVGFAARIREGRLGDGRQRLGTQRRRRRGARDDRRARACSSGLKPLAKIKAFASSGVDPVDHGHGSGSRVEAARWRRPAGKHADLDLMEINEAFAAQACAVNKEMGWDTSKINVNGGAIALGHPIGASGCRVLVTLLHEMGRRNAKKGLASLCIGGGMGVALAVER